MSEWDQQLREALRRVEPPPGLAERILANLPPVPQRQSKRRPLVFLAMAAALIILFLGALIHHRRMEQQQQQRAQEARRELVFALRVTAAKLAVVQSRLQRSALPLPFLRKETEHL
jgi:lysophospholipase L1-like esterase